VYVITARQLRANLASFTHANTPTLVGDAEEPTCIIVPLFKSRYNGRAQRRAVIAEAQRQVNRSLQDLRHVTG
jgi:hypothetical protein